MAEEPRWCERRSGPRHPRAQARDAGVSAPSRPARHVRERQLRGAHPAALEAIAEANAGGRPPTRRRLYAGARERMRELFGDVETFPVFNGTGGNVTALGTVMRPYEAVICPQTAHINVDEAGLRSASRLQAGRPATPDGKLTPELVGAPSSASATSTMCSSRGVGQPVDRAGTVYTREETARWRRRARARPVAARRRGATDQCRVSLGTGRARSRPTAASTC